MARQGAYKRIIEHIFLSSYVPGTTEIGFSVDDIVDAATDLSLERPRNIPDLIYNAVYRRGLPAEIVRNAPEGYEWVVRIEGDGRYRFALERPLDLSPNASLTAIKILDATPGIISMYALGDEQALAKLRYNRLLDVFMGMACYSLQSHLRTRANGAQSETDEVYVGVDSDGAHYVVPVQAKGGSDRLHRVQIEQDMAMCREKFSTAVCRPVAAQFMRGDEIALFEMASSDGRILIARERHYRLVQGIELGPEELRAYQATRGTGV